MAVKDEFLVERQGRKFVLYAGLLDLATSMGLKSLTAQIMQYPCPENNNTCFARAVAVMEKDGHERVFEECADASPRNVTPAMQNCIPRMALTRAKARALRDATNVGVTAFEELDEDEQGNRPAPEQAPSKGAAKPAPPVSGPQPQEGGEDPEYSRAPSAGGKPDKPTETQQKAIKNLCTQYGWDINTLDPPVNTWTAKMASDWISEVTKRANQSKRKAA